MFHICLIQDSGLYSCSFSAWKDGWMNRQVNIGGKLIDHLTFMDFSEIFHKFKMVPFTDFFV